MMIDFVFSRGALGNHHGMSLSLGTLSKNGPVHRSNLQLHPDSLEHTKLIKSVLVGDQSMGSPIFGTPWIQIYTWVLTLILFQQPGTIDPSDGLA
jgi:hypothetical protein